MQRIVSLCARIWSSKVARSVRDCGDTVIIIIIIDNYKVACEEDKVTLRQKLLKVWSTLGCIYVLAVAF